MYRLIIAFLSVLMITRYARAETSILPPTMSDHAVPSAPAIDGWVGHATRFVLRQSQELIPLVIRGQIPAIGDTPFTPTLKVSIDGLDVLKQQLKPGDFEARAIIVGSIGDKNVDVTFDSTRTLPLPDTRSVSALLFNVGFEHICENHEAWFNANTPNRDIATPDDGVGLGANWFPLENWKGQHFRWAGRGAQLIVASKKPGILTLELEAGPSIAEGTSGTLCLESKDGRLLDKIPLRTRMPIDLAVSASALLEQPLKLEVIGGGHTIPGDDRILDVRVFSAWYHAQP